LLHYFYCSTISIAPLFLLLHYFYCSTISIATLCLHGTLQSEHFLISLKLREQGARVHSLSRQCMYRYIMSFSGDRMFQVRSAEQVTGGWVDSPEVSLVSTMSVTGESSESEL
jgi:hypothetical protein